jgi:hypothetical protein
MYIGDFLVQVLPWVIQAISVTMDIISVTVDIIRFPLCVLGHNTAIWALTSARLIATQACRRVSMTNSTTVATHKHILASSTEPWTIESVSCTHVSMEANPVISGIAW